MNSYTELVQCLKAKGVNSYLQNAHQLVVSSQNPAMPNSNCFWVTITNERWYLGTWLPAIYQVPCDRDICSVCDLVLRSSSRAIYTVDATLVESLGLRRLDEQEAESLGLS